jgi:hypothetical protein
MWRVEDHHGHATEIALGLLVALAAAGCSTDTVLLALENRSAMSVWVQAEGASNQPGWVGLRSATGLLLSSPTTCEGECGPWVSQRDDCYGRADWPWARELAPGAALETEWDGSYWVYDADGACWSNEQQDAEAGDTARFCWGSRFRLDPDGVGTSIAWASCADRSFVRSRGDEVRQVISAAEPELAVKLVLWNQGQAPIYVQRSNGCVPDEPAWFEVQFDGMPLELFPSCALCLCPAGPGQCDDNCATCGDPTADVLAQGESIEYVWNGRSYLTRSDPTCQQLAPAPIGPLEVKMCWGLGVWPSGQVTEPQCQSKEVWLAADQEVQIGAGG